MEASSTHALYKYKKMYNNKKSFARFQVIPRKRGLGGNARVAGTALNGLRPEEAAAPTSGGTAAASASAPAPAPAAPMPPLPQFEVGQGIEALRDGGGGRGEGMWLPGMVLALCADGCDVGFDDGVDVCGVPLARVRAAAASAAASAAAFAPKPAAGLPPRATTPGDDATKRAGAASGTAAKRKAARAAGAAAPRVGTKVGAVHAYSGAEHWLNGFDSRFDESLGKLDTIGKF